MENLKASYDEVSPISGELTVLVEPLDESKKVFQKMCVSSGFFTQTNWKVESDEVANYMENITQHNIDNCIIAEDGLVWFPYAISTSKATLYAHEQEGSFKWFVMPVEQEVNEDNQVIQKIGNTNSKVFEKDQFPNALNHFFVLEMR